MHVYKATPSGFIPHGVTGWPHGATGANGALTHFHKKKVQKCVWRNSEPRKCVRKVQKCVRKNPGELSRHIFKSPDKKNVSGKSPKMCPETPKMCPEKSWKVPNQILTQNLSKMLQKCVRKILAGTFLGKICREPGKLRSRAPSCKCELGMCTQPYPKTDRPIIFEIGADGMVRTLMRRYLSAHKTHHHRRNFVAIFSLTTVGAELTEKEHRFEANGPFSAPSQLRRAPFLRAPFRLSRQT